MLTQRQINLAALPDLCYAVSLETGETIVLKKDETGYYPTGYGVQGQEVVDRLNERLGVTKAQVAAMTLGSVAGFHAPGADPACYDENGVYKREGRA
uniref:Uncharacterized protein n=1 Tax=Caulobacter phage BL57 TaxID=3348355 RepID=A0AB74UII9_9VIRU